MTTASSADTRRGELVERFVGSALGAMDLLCVYLGDRLGMYRALAETGPSTSAELASAAGVNERYAREWLEQQAMAGILDAMNPHASDAERRYAVPAGHDEVLLDGSSLNHMAPMAQLVVACALPIHAVLETFETGDGVPCADYGADLHEGQARFTEPLFDNLLATDGFPPWRRSTIASPAIPRACRRPCVRAGPVEHGDHGDGGTWSGDDADDGRVSVGDWGPRCCVASSVVPLSRLSRRPYRRRWTAVLRRRHLLRDGCSCASDLVPGISSPACPS
jgi:hypothetical protein